MNSKAGLTQHEINQGRIYGIILLLIFLVFINHLTNEKKATQRVAFKLTQREKPIDYGLKDCTPIGFKYTNKRV